MKRDLTWRGLLASLILCLGTGSAVFAEAADSVRELSPGSSEWTFLDPGNRFAVEGDVERHYDLPFSGKEVVSWEGKGVGDQTVAYELPVESRDLSACNALKLWLKFDLIDGETRNWDQLFVPGSDDGNVHVMLFDEAGNSATAYIQRPGLFDQAGAWREVTLSLKKDFGSYAGLDSSRIRSIAVGFNVLNDDANASLPYRFSFAGLQFLAKEPETKTLSKIFPAQYMAPGRAYLLKDYPTWLHVALASSKETVAALPEEYVFEIDIPSPMALRGVNGYLAGWNKVLPETPVSYWGFAPQLEDWQDGDPSISEEKVTRDGIDYTRKKITLKRANAESNLRDVLDGPFTSGLDLYVSHQPGVPSTGRLYWRCEEIGLDWQSVEYEVMPELPKGPAPKRLTTLVFCGGELGLESAWPDAVRLFKAAGFNSYTSSGWISPRIKRWQDLLKGQGVKVYIGGQTGIYASTYSTKPGDKSLWEYFDGKPNKWGIACLTYCAQDGEKYQEALYPFYKHADDYYAPNGLVSDFEMNDVVAMGYDCPRCQQAFREHLALGNEELNGALIRTKYNEEFKKFRLEQIGQLARKWSAVMRKDAPRAEVVLCSGHVPLGAEAAKKYIEHSGSDPRLWDALVDEHWPMVYYNGVTCFRDIEETVKVLEKPVVPLLGSGWAVGVSQFTPVQCELNALASLLAGARGFGYFIGFAAWDGMYWDKLARVSHLAAEIEDVLLDGSDVTKEVRIEGTPAGGQCIAKVYRHKDEILIGAINYSGKPASVVVPLDPEWPKSSMTVLYDNRDRAASVAVKENNAVKLNLGGEESAVIRLSGGH